MSVQHLKDKIDEAVNDFLDDLTQNDRSVTYDIGLDPRAIPRNFWFDRNNLAIYADNRRMLDYYGGFEYVDSAYVTIAGSFVIYSREHHRVEQVLDRLMEIKEAAEEAARKEDEEEELAA